MQAFPLMALIGASAPALIEWVKRNPNIPFLTAETKGKLLALAALLSALGAVLATVVSGDFDQSAMAALGDTLTNFVTVFGISELSYRHVYKKLEPAAEGEQG